jgi:hypothetical protein
VVVVFAVSRWVYWNVLGIRFDTSPTHYFIQYLHPWFVEHDFLRSVLYLHHQGPLQILVAQGCIKVLGMRRATVVLECLYRALGLSLSLGLVQVLRGLGARPLLATVAVSLYEASPTFVLYESWLFYPLPTAALLVFALVALMRYQRLGTFAAALLFFAVLGVLALLRATYGSIFLSAATALLLFYPSRAASGSARRTVLKAAALPLLVVTLNTAKTSWLVGHPYGSALLWANLPLKVFVQLPASVREQLVDRGLVSAAANYRGVAADVDEYGRFAVPHRPTGVPLLDLDHPPGGGNNAHALEHVLVAENVYRPDAVYLLKHYPGTYAWSIWNALSSQYVSSAALADGLDGAKNFNRLDPVRSIVERCLGVGRDHRLLALMFALPLSVLYGLYRIGAIGAVVESERTSGIVIAFALLGILYAGGVTLLVSYGDFGRYRFEVDPLYLVLIALGLNEAGDAIRRAASWFARSLARRRLSDPSPDADASLHM